MPYLLARRLEIPFMKSLPKWLDEGMGHIWLPYCQMKVAPPPLPVISTSHCTITLADGRTLIDGTSSWWTACHGYNHPHILQAMEAQLKQMPHVMFGGLTHEPALTLASRLVKHTPPGVSRVFFTDSGSIAVEVAMKMALQFWKNKGKPSKDRFICFSDGYHGDTFGAMSVSDPEKSMHKAFRHAVVRQYVVNIPTDEYSFQELDALLSHAHKEIAGMIIEPLVQGAGGMRFHSADVLAELHRIAKKYDVLFIADEIATGFGRTGSMFACDEAGISPDILCIGKALTGGAITLAAACSTEEIFTAFLSDDWESALMHGPTYMANPLACAAANASLDLFEREPRLQQAEAIESVLRSELAACESLTNVVDVRVKGAIGVVQLAPEVNVFSLRPKFVEHGVWVRPFKDIVYLMPPLVINENELKQLTRAVFEVIKKGPA